MLIGPQNGSLACLEVLDTLVCVCLQNISNVLTLSGLYVDLREMVFMKLSSLKYLLFEEQIRVL